MPIPVFASFDMNQNEVLNFAFQNVAAFPLTPVVGQPAYLIPTNTLYVWNGTVWSAVGAGVQKFSATIGPGAGPFVIVHNLGTLDTVESIYDTVTGFEILATIDHSSVNSTTILVNTALLTPARVVILG